MSEIQIENWFKHITVGITISALNLCLLFGHFILSWKYLIREYTHARTWHKITWYNMVQHIMTFDVLHYVIPCYSVPCSCVCVYLCVCVFVYVCVCVCVYVIDVKRIMFLNLPLLYHPKNNFSYLSLSILPLSSIHRSLDCYIFILKPIIYRTLKMAVYYC